MTTAWGGGMHECKQSPPWEIASLAILAAPSPSLPDRISSSLPSKG